ncbi:MAG TPA: tetratricopeptide repeat protein [Gemmatimonadales bacterium]|nr:tetratricopeptide repeat protein [Gemmatimonadales bacterium]
MSKHRVGMCASVALFVVAAFPANGFAQRIKMSVKVPELETRVKQDSNDAAAHYNLALGYWSEKRYDEAEKQLRAAIQVEPRFAVAHLGLAFLPYARRSKLFVEAYEGEVPAEWKPKLEEADREFRHAFMIDPLVDLRIIGAVTPSSPDFVGISKAWGEDWALYLQGYEDCQEGKYEDCNGRFAAFIKSIDGDRFGDRIPDIVLWYKGLAAAHIGKFDDAIAHFQTLMDRDSTRARVRKEKGFDPHLSLRTNEYRYTLATIKQAAGKTVEARALYQEALANDLGLYMAHVQLAGIAEMERDFNTAITERRRAVDANPDDPSLFIDLGVTLGKAGQMEEAVAMLERAADANPRDSRPLYWLGIGYTQLNRIPDARKSFTHFIEMAPSRYDKQIAAAKDRLAKLPQ